MTYKLVMWWLTHDGDRMHTVKDEVAERALGGTILNMRRSLTHLNATFQSVTVSDAAETEDGASFCSSRCTPDKE